jgi:hypothetical protein
MKLQFTVALLIALSLSITTQAQDARLLIIGVDGCRADVIASATTTNMDNLMQTGYYTLNGLTASPTWSGVGWTSMVTGVWRDKHGVNDNSYIGQDLDYPHFFKRINDQVPGLNKYSIVHWGPINTHLSNFNAGEQQFTYGSDLEVENKVVDVLTNDNPDVVFVHFDDVDHAGHYVASIETVDARIGSALTALYNRPNYASENWLVMVSTDHGGNASGHGGASIEERTIFIIAAGAVDQLGETSLAETTYNSGAHVDLDGTTLTYLDCGNPTGNLEIGENDFTVECWVKTNGWSGDPAIISNKNWDNGFNEGFILAGTTDGSTWKFNIGSDIVRYDLDGSTIDDGQWHHLAVTVDRNGDITAYQDGSITDQTTIIGGIEIDSDLGLCFGQDGTTTYSHGIEMSLSEVRMWNLALTQDAIVDYMCADLDANHPFNLSLVGHWPLADNSGTVALSNVGSNHAVFAGGVSWQTTGSEKTCYDQSAIPEMVDIPYTALTHLCIDIDPVWELDGKTFGVNECMKTAVSDKTQNQFSLFPNPVTDLIKIESEYLIKSIQIHDSLGRITLRKSDSNTVDVSNLDNGIYTISIQTEEFVSSQRLLIQK